MIHFLDALWGLVALAALLFVTYGPWQWICTDFARQILFEKRDALFDLAHAGKIDFASQEYRELRTSLETLIRFCHEVTLTRIVYLTKSLKLTKTDLQEKSLIETSIKKIHNKSTRAEIDLLFREAHLAVVSMIIFKSPLLIFIFLLLSPVVVFLTLTAIALGAIRHWWSKVEQIALIVGNTVQAEANLSPHIRVACRF